MIVLVGFMGAGKTTVGRLLAAKVGLPFVDTDDLVQHRAGMSIPEIFKKLGEPAFRELEREVVLETLEGPESVVALGGGSLGDPAVATMLQHAQVVHLDVSYGESRRRLGTGESRPMLGRADPKALYESRRRSYEMVRHQVVSTDHRSPDEIARQIAVDIKGSSVAHEQVQRVVVPLRDRRYEITVGRDLLHRFPALVPGVREAQKVFVITHPGLERYAKEIEPSLVEAGCRVEHLHIDEGEGSKTLEVVSGLWAELARRQAHRSDYVLAIGGGVVSDVAGFVAATYMRGLPLVHMPTTLLGQVDAAIGGKCGVNTPEGKNLIGSIYQPRAVVCDVDLLSSLPEEEFRSGMAEVVKYGFIADPDLLEGIEEAYGRIYDGHALSLINVVTRSAAIKSSFVAADELDTGKRAFLNYGHTFAHAIETIRGFQGIRHGEAVSLGMMAAAYLSNELGRLSEYGVAVHQRVLTGLGLPTRADLDLDQLEAAWQHDKKFEGSVRFVLLDEIGSPVSGVEAPRGSVGAALRRLSGT